MLRCGRHRATTLGKSRYFSRQRPFAANLAKVPKVPSRVRAVTSRKDGIIMAMAAIMTDGMLHLPLLLLLGTVAGVTVGTVDGAIVGIILP